MDKMITKPTNKIIRDGFYYSYHIFFLSPKKITVLFLERMRFEFHDYVDTL